MESHSEPQTHCERQATLVTNKQMEPNQIASGVGDQNQQHVAGDQVWPLPSTLRGHDDIGNQHHSHQDSIPKTLHKGVKGGSVLSIATFGYQILRCPHFAELCWVTSKLKEGPCADVNGPWKRWPFNSCVMNTCSSPEKVVTGVNSNPKDRELSGTVRGLIAVGLLAYRGIYTSVREVSFEVRKVLELLVGQIRARISGRKDTFRYLRILSQVAYLEDVVNSWAYTFRSLPVESQRAAPNAKPTILGDTAMDIGLNENYILGNRSSVPIVPEKGCNELQDMLARGNPDEFVNDVDDSNLIQGLASQSLSTSDVCVLEKGEPFPSAPCPSGRYRNNFALAFSLSVTAFAPGCLCLRLHPRPWPPNPPPHCPTFIPLFPPPPPVIPDPPPSSLLSPWQRCCGRGHVSPPALRLSSPSSLSTFVEGLRVRSVRACG
ncbi:hypothetical protein BHE74_00036981 [Ensete ventricosum]|nr:hypothetical protein BHE74_00036981 [Ensete ventricosum]